MYSVEGLTEGIKNCRRNIIVLKEAIAKEHNTIKEYRIMIDSLETAAKKKAAAEAGVHVEVVES